MTSLSSPALREAASPVPLVVLNFNQLTYLRNLVAWWRWYSDAPIYVLDNHSDYPPLLEYYRQDTALMVQYCQENRCVENLRVFLDEHIHPRYSHYVISDADISPHPATPPTFLGVLRHAIDNMGFHRAGLGLITHDLPAWTTDREAVLRNEGSMRSEAVQVVYGEGVYDGHRAPIDTTFCMFTTNNGGWYAPMKLDDWMNCLRIFEAFHLPWYIDGANVNSEMDHYFRTAQFRDHGPVSAGKNNYRPQQYEPPGGPPGPPLGVRARRALEGSRALLARGVGRRSRGT